MRVNVAPPAMLGGGQACRPTCAAPTSLARVGVTWGARQVEQFLGRLERKRSRDESAWFAQASPRSLGSASVRCRGAQTLPAGARRNAGADQFGCTRLGGARTLARLCRGRGGGIGGRAALHVVAGAAPQAFSGGAPAAPGQRCVPAAGAPAGGRRGQRPSCAGNGGGGMGGRGVARGSAAFGPQASVRVAASGVPFPRVAQAVQAALRACRGSGAAIWCDGRAARACAGYGRPPGCVGRLGPPAGCDGCHGGPLSQLPPQERNLILNLQSQLLHARFAVGRARVARVAITPLCARRRRMRLRRKRYGLRRSASGAATDPPDRQNQVLLCATALPRVGARAPGQRQPRGARLHWWRRATGSGG